MTFSPDGGGFSEGRSERVTTTPDESWLALDVGGANIKAAHSSGAVRSDPFELWKRPLELGAALARVAEAYPRPDRVALTMTAELCDCYRTKREGVHAVLDAVSAALPGRPVDVWGLDGRLRPIEEVRERPDTAAAANWLALATVAAEAVGPGSGLLVDVGSTTTDLIPLRDGRVAAQGRTDTERLQTGELVYAGVRRTPVFALADRLPFRGRATGLAAELFATTLDVFVTLGEVPEDPDDRSTADGRPVTLDASRDRLARMIGADREGFSATDAVRFADSVREAFLSRLAVAADRQGSRRPAVVVVSGSGEFLARRFAARRLGAGGRLLSLSEEWGPAASDAACAWAALADRRGCAEARLERFSFSLRTSRGRKGTRTGRGQARGEAGNQAGFLAI